jgi:hypothetical protein
MAAMSGDVGHPMLLQLEAEITAREAQLADLRPIDEQITFHQQEISLLTRAVDDIKPQIEVLRDREGRLMMSLQSAEAKLADLMARKSQHALQLGLPPGAVLITSAAAAKHQMLHQMLSNMASHAQPQLQQLLAEFQTSMAAEPPPIAGACHPAGEGAFALHLRSLGQPPREVVADPYSQSVDGGRSFSAFSQDSISDDDLLEAARVKDAQMEVQYAEVPMFTPKKPKKGGTTTPPPHTPVPQTFPPTGGSMVSPLTAPVHMQDTPVPPPPSPPFHVAVTPVPVFQLATGGTPRS